jgi:hypothetical protein
MNGDTSKNVSNMQDIKMKQEPRVFYAPNPRGPSPSQTQTQIPPLNASDARNAQMDPFKEVAFVPAAENPYQTPTRGIEVS